MQDYSTTPGFIEAANPFEAASNLGRKRGAEDEAVQVQYSDAQHPVMPLPKRRITDATNLPTMASLNANGMQADTTPAADPNAYHAFDLLPHSPQHSLSLYPNQQQSFPPSPGIHTDAMGGYGYYSGTIAVTSPGDGSVDPAAKHVLRHIQMPSYNPSNPSSSLNSPSAQSVFTSTTGTDADQPFLFEHDSPDMMRDEDTSVDLNHAMNGQMQMGNGNEEAMMQQMQMQMQMQQQQQQQQQIMLMQQQQQEQFLLQQQQAQGQTQPQPAPHPMLNPSHVHPLSGLAGSGLFTTQNPIQAAYDSYNGGFLDEFEEDNIATRRYTGNTGDGYTARLEGVMGHA